MDFPPVWVVDANILIDLHRGGVIEHVFRLGVRLVAPDVIVGELLEPDGAAAYSTVTDLARLRGWSTSVPLSTATW